MKIDLRDNIEHHCEQCNKNMTTKCELCFFGSVDMGKPDLGGKEQYNRAFHLLKVKNVRGFKRQRPFGNYLNIPTERIAV